MDKPFASYNATSHTFAISYTKFGTDYHTPSAGAIYMVRAVNVSPTTPTPSFGPHRSRSGPTTKPSSTKERRPRSPTTATPTSHGNTILVGSPTRRCHIMIARVPPAPAVPTPAAVVTSGQLHANANGGVKSLSTVPIVGYSRGNGQDFPSIAYNPTTNRVIVEWNDASHHPLGDIFLRSLDANLSLTAPIMKVNDDDSYTLHFMPAVSVRSDGSIASSWYDRRLWGPDSTLTDYFAEVRPSAGIDHQRLPGHDLVDQLGRREQRHQPELRRLHRQRLDRNHYLLHLVRRPPRHPPTLRRQPLTRIRLRAECARSALRCGV